MVKNDNCSQSLLENHNLLSVNQLNDQSKLLEMWKAAYLQGKVQGNRLKITQTAKPAEAAVTRSSNSLFLKEQGFPV